MSERLAGLRRLAWWQKDSARSRCTHASLCGWRCSGNYDVVCRLARAHTRETGHPLDVLAIRVVRYTRDG